MAPSETDGETAALIIEGNNPGQTHNLNLMHYPRGCLDIRYCLKTRTHKEVNFQGLSMS